MAGAVCNPSMELLCVMSASPVSTAPDGLLLSQSTRPDMWILYAPFVSGAMPAGPRVRYSPPWIRICPAPAVLWLTPCCPFLLPMQSARKMFVHALKVKPLPVLPKDCPVVYHSYPPSVARKTLPPMHEDAVMMSQLSKFKP